MRDNVKAFIALAARVFDPPGPVVEVGACQTAGQEGYADLRALFAGRTYLGCDMAPGPGVDRIEDVHALTFADGEIGTIVCADTLEHVADPVRAVSEIHRVLRPDGLAIVSLPFNYPIHYMPDYVRYTPEGVSHLLRAFALRAVLAHGDAQHPHTVNAVACKDAAQQAAFEAAVGRLQEAWGAAYPLDALLRYEPLVSLVRSVDWSNRPTGAGAAVEQQFVCARPNLCRIDALVGTLAPAPQPTRWRLQVRDEAGRVCADSDWIPSTGEQRWLAFPFAALPDSAGRTFTLALEPLGDVPATAFACDANKLPDGGLRIAGRPAPGALCVELLCQRP